jgi:hypothetical protein
MENLKERFSDLAIEDIQRIRGMIDAAVPDCLVRGYRPSQKGLSCRMLKMLMFWPTPLKLERKSSSHSINVIFLTKLWKNSTSKLSTQTIYSLPERRAEFGRNRASMASRSPALRSFRLSHRAKNDLPVRRSHSPWGARSERPLTMAPTGRGTRRFMMRVLGFSSVAL